MGAKKPSTGRRLLSDNAEYPDLIPEDLELTQDSDTVKSKVGLWRRRRRGVGFFKDVGNKAESGAKSVERGGKEVGSKAERGTKELANKAERGLKEVATKAEHASKVVERGLKAAWNWAKEQAAKFANMMVKAVNAAKNAIQKAANAVKKAAEKVWSAVKDGFWSTIEGIKNVAKSAVDGIQKFFDCLQKHLPMFQSVAIGNIYVGCMTNPKKCSSSKIKVPQFSLCLSKIGCLKTPTKFTAEALLDWLKNNVIGLFKKWLDNYVEWKKAFDIKIPTGISTKCQCFDLTFPNGLRMTRKTYLGVSVSVPDVSNPFTYAKTNCWIRPCGIPSGISTKQLTFHYPKIKPEAFNNCRL